MKAKAHVITVWEKTGGLGLAPIKEFKAVSSVMSENAHLLNRI